MDEVKVYSKEWMISNCSKEQLKAIEKAAKGAKKIDRDVTLSDYTFEGKVEDVKKRLENGSRLNYSQKEAIKKIGVDKLLSIMDVNNDGEISSDEVQSVAMADNEELDLKSMAVLSTKDIKQIYENALASKNGEVGTLDNTTMYKLKDGSTIVIKRDEKGNIISKQETSKISDDEQKSVTYVYKDKTKETTIKNVKTNDTVTNYDAPGELNDKTVTSKHNSNGTKTVTTETIGKVTTLEFDEKGKNVGKKIDLKFDTDGKIDDFKQMGYGDCWLLASLNALKDTVIGSKLIKESVIHKSNGDITINLKGVKKSYTFTPEEIVQAINDGKKIGKRYSEGDIDVVLFELAVQRFRKEDNRDLNSGTMDEGFKILTGKSSMMSFFGIAEPFMLDAKKKNPEKYALIAAFEGPDYSVSYDIENQHAYSISRVDDKNVYIVNPHDTSKEIVYPIDKFKKNCIALSSINLDKIKK